MFYHQEILQRRGGKFGTIWIAATKIDKLKKRELSSVDIHRTCEEIIKYIMVQVQPKIQGKGRPRFSLYLSSQLMYGIVRVYSRQGTFLLEDTSSFFSKVRLAATAASEGEIDLKALCRTDLVTNPDIDTMASPSRPGYNPMFGHFQQEHKPLQDFDFMDMEIQRIHSSMAQFQDQIVSPEIHPHVSVSIHSVSTTETGPPFRPEFGSPHTVSSIEQITMKDVEARIPEIEALGEKELPGFDGQDLNVILEEPVHTEKMDWVGILSPVHLPEEPVDTQKLVQQMDVLSPKEKTPLTKPDVELPIPRDITLSPGITPVPEHAHRHARRQHPSLTLQLSPLPPSPIRRQRKRQLFIDQDTQIHHRDLKRHIATSKDTCQPFVLPDVRHSTVNQLFKLPYSKELRREPFLRLWQRNTKFGILETAVDKAMPVWTVPYITEEEPVMTKRRKQDQRPSLDLSVELPREPEVQQIDVEMPSMEMPREASVSIETSRHIDDESVSMQKSLLSEGDKSVKDTSLEGSLTKRGSRGRSKSHGRLSSEEELDLPAAAEPEVSISVGDLSVIQEELQPVVTKQQPVHDTKSSSASEDLIRIVNTLTRKKKWISFHDICPTESTSRKTAARTFSTLLDLCATMKLKAEQRMPFGDIHICRGSEHW